MPLKAIIHCGEREKMKFYIIKTKYSIETGFLIYFS